MSAPKFTPGPWQVSGVRAKYRDAHREHVFEAHNVGPDGDAIAAVFFNPTSGLGWKDAHLIAAAPELYAALEALIEEAVDVWDYDPDYKHIADARAALAKARGDQ